MNLKPTHVNLIVIRSHDLDRAESFYEKIGLKFLRHRHGNGPEHLASESLGFVFEIYPRQNEADTTSSVRIGFEVDDVDATIEDLRATNAVVISKPRESAWGRRAVVQDIDGHKVELVSVRDADKKS